MTPVQLVALLAIVVGVTLIVMGTVSLVKSISKKLENHR